MTTINGPYRFSERSLLHLASCDPALRSVFNAVIEIADCTIIEGHRDEATQNEMVRTGKSQLRWPNSKHNSKPSRAVDVAPYFAGVGIPWDDVRSFDYFAGIVMGVAATKGVGLRWGGDWNGNRRPGDASKFHDLPHFELIGD